MFRVTADESLLDSSGKVMVFSFERFVSDIVKGDCCFVCGARPESTDFNDEHILPDWILRKFNLYSHAITLPNGTKYRYDQFKIPCCSECNSKMGEELEQPISEMFAQSYEAFGDQVKAKGPWRLFCWMCLIFIKTHLKDNNLRFTKTSEKAPRRSVKCIAGEKCTNSLHG